MTLMILLIVAILLAGWVAFCGYRWSWGPFASLHTGKTSSFFSGACRLSTFLLSGCQVAMES